MVNRQGDMGCVWGRGGAGGEGDWVGGGAGREGVVGGGVERYMGG
jgi:hypothetical protein